MENAAFDGHILVTDNNMGMTQRYLEALSNSYNHVNTKQILTGSISDSPPTAKEPYLKSSGTVKLSSELPEEELRAIISSVFSGDYAGQAAPIADLLANSRKYWKKENGSAVDTWFRNLMLWCPKSNGLDVILTLEGKSETGSAISLDPYDAWHAFDKENFKARGGINWYLDRSILHVKTKNLSYGRISNNVPGTESYDGVHLSMLLLPVDSKEYHC
jgi:hypothetical protein